MNPDQKSERERAFDLANSTKVKVVKNKVALSFKYVRTTAISEKSTAERRIVYDKSRTREC